MSLIGFFYDLLRFVLICTLLFCLCTIAAIGNDEAVAEPMWSYKAEGSVSSLELSADGDYLVIQTDKNVYLFDNQGRKLWNSGMDHTICEVAISSDGSYVASGTCTQYGHEVVLFDRQGRKLWSYDTSGWIGDLAISSDGRYLASIGYRDLYLFDSQKTKLWESRTGSGGSVDITADGSLIVADGSGYEFSLFDNKGNKLWSYEADGQFYSLAISKDGSYIAAGCNDDNLYFFDQHGSLLWSYKAGDCINSVAIASDGSYIAAGSWDDRVYLFDARGNMLWSYKTGDAIESVAISSDGSCIAAGSSDNMIYLFDREGRKLWSYETEGSVEDITLSSDGRYVAAATHFPDSSVYFFAADASSKPTQTTPAISEISPSSSEVEVVESAEITDDSAGMVGQFPALLNDGDDSTYVRGDPSAGDWDARFKMSVVKTDPLKFRARVECLEGGCGSKTVCGFQFFAKNLVTGKDDMLQGAAGEETGIHEYELILEEPDKYISNGEVDFLLSNQCNTEGRILEFYQLGAEPASEPEPDSVATIGLENSDRVFTTNENVLVQRVLEAETELYDSMWDLVALDRDGYIFTYSESFADIILNATKVGQEEEMDEESFKSIWDLFIGQFWSSTSSAMSAAGLEVPSEISTFLGSDISDVSLKQATDVGGERAGQFLDEEKAKYVMWGGCYIGLRTLVYADDLEALTKEHQAFQTYWMNKSDNQLIAAFGTRDNVDRFIEILGSWSQRFEERGLKEYKFKSDTLGDSAEGQVARAMWEASRGIDSYDSRTQLIGKRVVNKFPRAMMGVNYFQSSKSIWDVIDVVGRTVPGGSEVSILVNDIGFNGCYLATIVLAHMAMEQDIDQMSTILEELNFFSDWSSENPGEFGIFVDDYYGLAGV